MGLWADTFGDGNTFAQSVANTFTPNDGTTYSGGQLVNDDNSTPSFSSYYDAIDAGYGGQVVTINGKSVVAATADGYKGNGSYSGNYVSGGSSGVKGEAGTVSELFGKPLGYLTQTNPSKDKTTTVGDRMVYQRDDGSYYSYNFLGLPYDIKADENGGVAVDKYGNPMDGTDYSRIQQLRDEGRDTEADQLEQVQQANAEEAAAPTANVDSAMQRYDAIVEGSGIGASNEQVQALANNPTGFMSDIGANLSSQVPLMNGDAAGTTLNPNDPRYALNYQTGYTADQAYTNTVTAPGAKTAATATTADAVDRVTGAAYTVEAQQGTVDQNNLVNAEDYTLDMQGMATGTNADGSTNATGQAINAVATQNISQVIDTSTVAGKLLAQSLGEGNYTDSKSTILGQLNIIKAEFTNPDGTPKIPAWGQSVARDLNRTIAFTGVTGTAAKAAVANAMMEATLGIAEKEAKFFQTVTLENLSNRQQTTINKANILANMEQENLSAREAAAVNNAKTFLQMDLTNLDNQQQAEIVNKQARVDALFTATAEENVNRRFNITNAMDMTKFYDELSFQAATFNAESKNANERFNAGENNAAAQFSISQEASRQQFEANMAYSIDQANAKWRQTVETTNTAMKFDAASTDVKNALGLSTEALNRIWDRVDSQLDYIWRSSEADEQRDYDLLVAEMQAAGAAAAAKSQSKGSIIGSLIGGAVKLGVASIASDIRLKKDIEHVDTLPNGVKIYSWAWNEEAKRIGADMYPGFGVLAQEVQKTHPDAVEEGEDGYLRVNYKKVLP